MAGPCKERSDNIALSLANQIHIPKSEFNACIVYVRDMHRRTDKHARLSFQPLHAESESDSITKSEMYSTTKSELFL
jgi:hypothetical protein